jgi:stage V sporulation protein D (sporulation-specific penicillin-binding protein)
VGFAGKVGNLQLAGEEAHWKRDPLKPRRLREEVVPARRGTLYTRNGTPVVVTIDRKAVTANPQVRRDAAAVARTLAGLLGQPEPLLREQLTKKRQADGSPNFYVKLCREAPARAQDRLLPRTSRYPLQDDECAEFPGVYLSTWYERRYPLGSFASQLLGGIRDDGVPTGGIERFYQDRLAGRDAERKYEVDASGHAVPNGYSREVPAKQGESLVLTLDEHLQRAAETALAQCLEQFSPQFACALVLHPPTGQVLAWACAPSFDPNHVRPQDLKSMNNRPVTFLFEPGSTLKPVVAGIIAENTTDWQSRRYDCTGLMRLGNRQKHCWILSEKGHGHGPQGLSDGICNSCNIAMMQFGLRLDARVLHAGFERFGLTKPTGCDVPYERSGMLSPYDTWSLQRHADVCYGQGIALTPLQLVTAISAIANGGKLMRPYVVSEAIDESGSRRPVGEPRVVRQALSRTTASQVTDMMVRVIEEGTGKAAAIPNVRVAGKTGSAQMAVNGHYPPGHYICTFTGFAPAESPRACVLVMAVEPKGAHWGSEVCGPTFKSIMQEALLHTEIRPVLTAGRPRGPDI